MLHSFRRIVYSCELITLFALHLRNGSCEIIQLSLYSVIGGVDNDKGWNHGWL